MAAQALKWPHNVLANASMTAACPLKICEVGGGGNILPAFGDSEQEWNRGVRIVLYMAGLAWAFMGVAIVSDVFMGAIERITSKRKRLIDKATGHNITVKVWNDTVANLTLMALGSSAPEILLSVIELTLGNMYSGQLGPATIVGSAAFNLFCISAVCVMAIPAGEIRYIKDMHVFIITASCSVFAYLWLYFIVIISSENIIMLWEALVTFFMFPVLISVAYYADIGGFSSMTMRDDVTHARISLAEGGISKAQLAEIEMAIAQKHAGENLSDADLAHLIEQEHMPSKTRAQYRVAATRGIVGGKRIADSVVATLSHLNPCAIVPTDMEDLKSEDITMEFCSATYSVVESIGTLNINVIRCGELDKVCQVDYKTRDGSAKANEDYSPVEGTLEFLSGEETKPISVKIIDDTAFEDDEEFFMDLANARCNDQNYTAAVGKNQSTQISIVDDDEPGILRFEEDTMKVTESLENKTIPITVRRSKGSNGKVSCKYTTEDHTATGGRDYMSTSGVVQFENGQTSSSIDVTVLPRGRYDIIEEFRIILSEPAGGAKFDDTQDGGTDTCILTVIIEADQDEIGRVDRVMQVLQMDWDKAQIGHANWKDQLRDAFFVNGGDEDAGTASLSDWAMHIVTVFWKVLFACIPPTDFCDGWACFICALIMIGAVTALIGDLAGLLGCTLGLPDSVTAITFVALGTSLPDTFASKTAAEQDPYADASIGNVTGSNSVNVFLGLGLPWSMGAVYWMQQEPNSETSNTWAAKYPAQAKDLNGEIQFIVLGGNLGFSVIIFSTLAILCVLTLVCRRKAFGGELGGPKYPQWATAVWFVFMWCLYIGLSSWKAISSNDCP